MQSTTQSVAGLEFTVETVEHYLTVSCHNSDKILMGENIIRIAEVPKAEPVWDEYSDGNVVHWTMEDSFRFLFVRFVHYVTSDEIDVWEVIVISDGELLSHFELFD